VSDEQKPKQIPLVPGQFPTHRASHSLFIHIGGAFVMSLLDERLVTGPDGTISSANFESGGFALGPVAALWLANNLLAALRDYQEKFGPLPKSVLPAAPLAQIGDAIAALEDMLKQSRQPPQEPPASGGSES
jgi:hypothetical protein